MKLAAHDENVLTVDEKTVFVPSNNINEVVRCGDYEEVPMEKIKKCYWEPRLDRNET